MRTMPDVASCNSSVTGHPSLEGQLGGIPSPDGTSTHPMWESKEHRVHSAAEQEWPATSTTSSRAGIHSAGPDVPSTPHTRGSLKLEQMIADISVSPKQHKQDPSMSADFKCDTSILPRSRSYSDTSMDHRPDPFRAPLQNPNAHYLSRPQHLPVRSHSGDLHRHLEDDDDGDSSSTERRESRASSSSSRWADDDESKKTKGRVRIKMEFIQNKLRRYTTFSKRKAGLMKKAFELSTLTGTQIMLLVASETGHVYTFATSKLQPMITSENGKSLIQACLNAPSTSETSSPHYETHDAARMSIAGYEETDLMYRVKEEPESMPMPGHPMMDMSAPVELPTPTYSNPPATKPYQPHTAHQPATSYHQGYHPMTQTTLDLQQCQQQQQQQPQQSFQSPSHLQVPTAMDMTRGVAAVSHHSQNTFFPQQQQQQASETRLFVSQTKQPSPQAQADLATQHAHATRYTHSPQQQHPHPQGGLDVTLHTAVTPSHTSSDYSTVLARSSKGTTPVHSMTGRGPQRDVTTATGLYHQLPPQEQQQQQTMTTAHGSGGGGGASGLSHQLPPGHIGSPTSHPHHMQGSVDSSAPPPAGTRYMYHGHHVPQTQSSPTSHPLRHTNAYHQSQAAPGRHYSM